jgi:predicted nucleotidyltransferase
MMHLRPRDFIACDGLVAAVTSLAHPEGPVVTPRYRQDERGLHKLDTAAARMFVRERHPGWLLQSPLLGAEVVVVPWPAIVRVLRPESRASALCAGAGVSAVERRAGTVVADLVRLGVPLERLGLTGSLLAGAATDASDIDVVAYGRRAFATARESLESHVANGRWHRLGAGDWREAWERRGAPGSLDEYRRHEERKGTKALVHGTRVDLSLLQDPEEGTTERPPYRKLRRFAIEATVTDASAAFDLPSRYGVRHDEVAEVVSYTATYAGQALAGERVRATGWLEEDAAGVRRLLVGTSREAAGESLAVIARDA